jgi:RND family efflux transporter MFP subunit
MSPSKATLDSLRIERGAAPNSPKRTFTFVVVTAAVVLAVAALIRWMTGPKTVEVHTVAARTAPASGADRTVLNASGYVTARRAATISSKVTGKVTEVLVEEGMKVTEGQVLARLDDTNVVASLELARAQLESARMALAETQVRGREADQDLARQVELSAKNVIARADFDHAEADAAAYKARLAQQQAEVTVAARTVATWQQQLDDTVMRAPFSGIVTSKNAQPGEMISPISAGGGFTRTGICTVVDMLSLEIEIDVNEAYINRVEPRQAVEATLDAYPNWKIPCKVIAIIPTADRDKSTVKVRIGFDRLDPRILPEMSAKVAFRELDGEAAVTASGSVIVPKAAVQQDAGRDVVMVVQGGRAERRAVTIASTTNSEAELKAGLSPGERVVVDPPKGLTDGASVTEASHE